MKNVSIYSIKLIREAHSEYPLTVQLYSPQSAAEILATYLQYVDREHLVLLFVSNKHKITGIHTAHVGTMTGAATSPREIFKAALSAHACRLVIGHNHPSGNCLPSKEDRVFTERLLEVGKLLDIPVIDHIIVGIEPGETTHNYFSFAQEGLIK